MGPLDTAELLIATSFVALLGCLHAGRWAHAQLTSPLKEPVRLDVVVHNLLGGRDLVARVLLVTAVAALSFAVGAPMFPGVLRALGSIVHGA